MKRLEKELLKDGWAHTKTLDAFFYIQYLHNDCEDIEGDIKSLSEIRHFDKSPL